VDINRANIETLMQEYQVTFTDAFNAAGPDAILANIAMVMQSSGSAVVHHWLNQIPNMREWVGDRVVKNIESNSLTVANKLYEATIEIPRVDIEDDNQGIYTPLVGLMGRNAALYPDTLCATALVTNDNWGGDEASFFSASTRTLDGTNYISNYVTDALSETTFETAYETMAGYIGQDGRALNVRPTALLFGPKLRDTAFDILQNDFRGIVAADASSYVAGRNRNQGLVTPIMSHELVGTYDDYWFLLGEIGGIRGVAYQQRMPAEFQRARFMDDSDFVFETDKYQLGARSRGAAFKTLPFLVYGGYV